MRAVASGAKSKKTGRRGRQGAGRAAWSRRLVLAMLGLLVLGLGYGFSLAGYGARVAVVVVDTVSSGADATLQLFGVSVRDVTVNGRRYARAGEILDALDVSRGASMLQFDPERARRRVLDVDWVRDATVSRLYPGSIVVNLTEYVPFAIWRHKGHISIISETGEVVSNRDAAWVADLPVVVGAGADQAAARIVPLLKQRPSLRAKIRVIERIGGRRWNLRLSNEVNVMLPANRVAAALDELIAIDARTGLLNRDITFVDMRIADRLTVRSATGGVSKIGLGKSGSRAIAGDKKT
ncbi:MAG: cell division protein FtsQ/DivIB [Hyphomicrobiales bacterium]